MLAAVSAQFGRWLASTLFTGLLFVVAWTVYVNVFESDAPVRYKAEPLARDVVGCNDKECRVVREESSRGIIHTTMTYTFDRHGDVVVKCRRKYIALGDYECSASRP